MSDGQSRMTDARAELLRGAVQALHGEGFPECAEAVEEAAAEIERLRAALRKIAALHPERIGYHGDIAQAALENRI